MASPPRKRFTGTVKWFNAKHGFGFITRHDTGEDIFVHKSAIMRPNRRHTTKSVGDGEVVEFGICASKVTGPGFKPVKGSPFVSQRGGRKSRPGSRRDERAKRNGPKEHSEEDKSHESEKRTQALTVQPDTTGVESVGLGDNICPDENIPVASTSRSGSRHDGHAEKNGPNDHSQEDESEELEKRTQALTIQPDRNAVEAVESGDETCSDEAGTAASYSAVTTEQ